MQVKGGDEAFRVEFPQGDQHQHGFALVNQPMGRRLEMEWVYRRPAKDAPAPPVVALLDSLDVTPYANPKRYVDWKDGWSMDVPAGSKRVADDRGRTVFEGEGLVSVRTLAAKGKTDDLQAELDALSARVEDLEGVDEKDELESLESGEPVGRAKLFRKRNAQATYGGAVVVRAGFLVAYLTPLGEDETVVGPAPKNALHRFVEGFAARADAGPRAVGTDESFARADAPKVTFRPPARWKKLAPTSEMRLVQYEVPGTEPAECIVFFFGAAGGGTLEANLERWKGQFEIEGTPSKTIEEVSKGVFATVLDVSGRYVAPIRPGAPEKHDKPGWRMLAAVVLAPDGPVYLKLVGPKATIDSAAKEFWAWVRSFRTKP
jgi:hypothetical protein